MPQSLRPRYAVRRESELRESHSRSGGKHVQSVVCACDESTRHSITLGRSWHKDGANYADAEFRDLAHGMIRA